MKPQLPTSHFPLHTRTDPLTSIFSQSIADAYYTLSDPARRSSYDRLRASKSDRERTSEASSSGSYFDFFKNAAKGTAGTTGGERPDAEFVFGDVFEDMVRSYEGTVLRFTP